MTWHKFHFLVIVLFGFAVYASLIGIDTGRHFDEQLYLMPAVRNTIHTGRILPGVYGYPSTWYHLTVLGLIPEAIKLADANQLSARSFLTSPLADNYDKIMKVRDSLIERTKELSFTLRIRSMFSIISMLSIIWVYLLVLYWRKDWKEAFLASALLGLSWEVAYQSRWTATDTLIMQFGALTMLCIVMAYVSRTRRSLWLMLSAVAGGFTLGTKFQGGLMLIPIITAVYFFARAEGARWKGYLLRMGVGTVGVFFLTYIITTPGMLLDPLRFFFELRHVLKAYLLDTGTFYVGSLWESLGIMVGFFGLNMFSKYAPIALIFFLSSLVGAWILVKKDRKMAAIFLPLPVVYIWYFGVLNTMFVRHLLFLVPFFAVLAAYGFSFIVEYLGKKPWMRYLLWSMVVVLLLINAWWLWFAADSIKNKENTNYLAKTAAYIDNHPKTIFAVSPLVAKELSAFDNVARTNITTTLSEQTHAAIFHSFEVAIDEKARVRLINEFPRITLEQLARPILEQPTGQGKLWGRWLANRWDYSDVWFGPYEINFNYYPNWFGNDRLVVMPKKYAEKLGLF